jgi:5-methylcytosine-specific restriction endonuclease McrBC GTP-binding regulatory subunit McrB
LILQGAPGVGKSFVARRLAYALMRFKDPTRVRTVQFHQSYSYEDFVQGYRPTGQGFALRDGVFLNFCNKALRDSSQTYVFIVDEINRGNLSKILGELMLLIEADKRSPEWAVKLAYAESADERFYVPPNVFILGMMNTADRSLAVVDYALRRRFVFVTLKPAFDQEAFKIPLSAANTSAGLVRRIIEKMTSLNEAIAADVVNLGPGFCIGHSFFTPQQGAESSNDQWYESVVEAEIVPLI